jgi:hypothetical protein
VPADPQAIHGRRRFFAFDLASKFRLGVAIDARQNGRSGDRMIRLSTGR